MTSERIQRVKNKNLDAYHPHNDSDQYTEFVQTCFFQSLLTRIEHTKNTGGQ
jgi:hypothetical protein